MMCVPISRHFLEMIYTSSKLEKRSTDGTGNTGLTKGETDALIVGIIGIVIAAVTMLKGWECWKSRRRAQDITDSAVDPQVSVPSPATTITNNFYYYLPPSSRPTHHPIPISPDHNNPASNGYDIPMHPITPQSDFVQSQSLPSPLPLPPPPVFCLERRAAGTRTRRVSTWPDATKYFTARN
ncbi:hypothetical protein BDD12DRAFT_930185 [Trichophaea hybrida]|nr:hypothetical protein BDD12DRAFT_930185 [Trichophaea hybrida]